MALGNLGAATLIFGAALTGGAAPARDGSPFAFPQPKFGVRLEKSVNVPMRDGAVLSTDLYFPEKLAERLPTILITTPYNKVTWRDALPPAEGSSQGAARMFASQGYVVAVQDVRGKWESSGLYSMYSDTQRDFADTLNWIARQDWSNGKVGTYGCSYLGESQVLEAAIRRPEHAAMIPQAAGGALGGAEGRYRYAAIRNGGALELGMALGWFMDNGSRYNLRLAGPVDRDTFVRIEPLFRFAASAPKYDFDAAAKSLPLQGLLMRNGGPISDWDDFIAWPMIDAKWSNRGYLRDQDGTNTPGLHVNSWYDYGVADTIATFAHFQKEPSSAVAQRNQYLIIGPATHCTNEILGAAAKAGERPIGDPRFDYWRLYLAWYDRWLRGNPHALDGTPKVQYYLLGRNEWRTADRFPPANSSRREVFLDSGGHSNSLFGDGRLSFDAPRVRAVDTFTYDPANPVPSIGGPLCCVAKSDMPEGALDQRPVEARADVLVYQTSPLQRPLTIVGPLELILYVSSDAADTDFTAKLVDVYPDGTAYNVQEGVLRARYREGFDREVFMQPGGIYELHVDLQATANQFLVGHRMRLEVSSSNFPRFDRNLNTGGRQYDETAWRTATNSVHHSPDRPSRLLVHVLPN